VTFVDINFDVYSDTPKGKDPDSYSATLRKYHQILWNKPLPNGLRFDLDDNTPRLLHHKSELGEFLLSSDSIGHTYSKVKSLSHIVAQIPSEEINSDSYRVRYKFMVIGWNLRGGNPVSQVINELRVINIASGGSLQGFTNHILRFYLSAK